MKQYLETIRHVCSATNIGSESGIDYSSFRWKDHRGILSSLAKDSIMTSWAVLRIHLKWKYIVLQLK